MHRDCAVPSRRKGEEGLACCFNTARMSTYERYSSKVYPVVPVCKTNRLFSVRAAAAA